MRRRQHEHLWPEDARVFTVQCSGLLRGHSMAPWPALPSLSEPLLRLSGQCLVQSSALGQCQARLSPCRAPGARAAKPATWASPATPPGPAWARRRRPVLCCRSVGCRDVPWLLQPWLLQPWLLQPWLLQPLHLPYCSQALPGKAMHQKSSLSSSSALPCSASRKCQVRAFPGTMTTDKAYAAYAVQGLGDGHPQLCQAEARVPKMPASNKARPEGLQRADAPSSLARLARLALRRWHVRRLCARRKRPAGVGQDDQDADSACRIFHTHWLLPCQAQIDHKRLCHIFGAARLLVESRLARHTLHACSWTSKCWECLHGHRGPAARLRSRAR